MAEIHQHQHGAQVDIVIPNTRKAEAMVGEMNRQLPAFLKHYLGDKGFTIPLQPLTIKIVGSTSSGGYTTTVFIYTRYLVSHSLHRK